MAESAALLVDDVLLGYLIRQWVLSLPIRLRLWLARNPTEFSNQLKVMSTIEACRSSKLGGHQLHCAKCDTDIIAYNSCRNRHCPNCKASSAKRWLEARQRQLLPVDYYHVVFTLPATISQLAFYNKADMYGLLMKAAPRTLATIAGDPKHLGAHIGTTMVLHTWGSAMASL